LLLYVHMFAPVCIYVCSCKPYARSCREDQNSDPLLALASSLRLVYLPSARPPSLFPLPPSFPPFSFPPSLDHPDSRGASVEANSGAVAYPAARTPTLPSTLCLHHSSPPHSPDSSSLRIQALSHIQLPVRLPSILFITPRLSSLPLDSLHYPSTLFITPRLSSLPLDSLHYPSTLHPNRYTLSPTK